MKNMIVVCVGSGMAYVLEMLEHKYAQKSSFLLIDTDGSVLVYRNLRQKVLIGKDKLFGLGAFNNPTLAKDAALDNKDFAQYLLHYKNVIVISALGGGTGTGATAVVVETAKRLGSNVLTFVSTPIKHDGRYAKKISEKAVEIIKQKSDILLVLENEKIAKLPNTGFELAQRMLFSKLDSNVV